jgi:glycerol-3-phosphate dehydrogenase subunit B
LSYDCVVIGAGLAGMTAAVRLASGGSRCAVVASGMGALYLGGAAIDVLGYAPHLVENPASELPDFCAKHPEHPYARTSIADVSHSLDWLKSQTGDGWIGTLDTNMLLPTGVGAAKPSALVPKSMAAGDLRTAHRIVLVGISCLKDFYPRLAAGNLETRSGIETRTIEVDVRPSRDAEISSLRYARALDDPEFRKQLMAALEGKVESDEAVGFPAVLGLRDARTVWLELQDALGAPVFEIPTLPPSIPGIRLFAQLKNALRTSGGRLILNATVVGAEASGSQVRTVLTESSGRGTALATQSVVLATGGVGSGGIAMDSRWRLSEPALGLPVAGGETIREERFKPDYFADHPIATAGIDTDEHLRPIDSHGTVIYENVFVAGGSLAGARPWHEKSGNGISLATGWSAAQRIMERAGEWN